MGCSTGYGGDEGLWQWHLYQHIHHARSLAVNPPHPCLQDEHTRERQTDRATHSSIPLRPASFPYSVSVTSMQAGFNAGFHTISAAVEGRKAAVSKA